MKLFWDIHFRKVCVTLMTGVWIFLPSSSEGQTIPANRSIDQLDEAAFRQGLRKRGLDDWLEQYYADVEPVNKIDRKLREREELLQQSKQSNVKLCRRKELVKKSSNILRELIEQHPQYHAHVRWQLELARDLIERHDPEAFDALLLYEMPGEDREAVGRLAGEAARLLRSARQRIRRKWKSIEHLDEETLQNRYTPSSLRLLEHTDTRSAILLVWARLYEALSHPQSEQSRRVFAELSQQVKEEYGWTTLPLDRADLRCNSLAIAALCARHLEQYEQAGEYARRIVAALKHVNDTAMRDRLRKTVLLGILEQIRALRAKGQHRKALGGIAQAHSWARRSWPNSLHVELALAFAKRSVLRVKAGNEPIIGNSLVDFLRPANALEPLHEVATRSPAYRDHLYTSLAGVLSGVSPQSSLTRFQMQLLAGSTIAKMLADCDGLNSEDQKTLELVIAGLEKTLDDSPADTFSTSRGELMYLLGRGYFLANRNLEAIQILTRLAEEDPGHDRTKAALRQATALARQELGQGNGPDSPALRSAFIRAGKMLRRMAPEDKDSQQLQYFIALALEKSGRLTEAGIEYGGVPETDPHWLEAALGRARCLRKRLRNATENGNDKKAQELAGVALSAAQSAFNMASKSNAPGKSRTAGQIVVLLANLQNHELINQSRQALKTLQGFEQKYGEFSSLVAQALRERIQANRRLDRFEQARTTGAKLLKIDPDNAAPLLADLLETIREKVSASEDEGDQQQVQQSAEEAHHLAEMLLQWCADHPEALKKEDLLIVRTWSAWAMLKADQTEQALERFQAVDLTYLQNDHPLRLEVRLGRAECLLKTGYPQEALKLFIKTWRETAEGSDPWWRSYVGSLRCHTALKNDPEHILQSIEQRRFLSPQFGAPRWKRAIKRIEATNRQRIAETTSTTQS